MSYAVLLLVLRYYYHMPDLIKCVVSSIKGPINAVAPNPVTNADFTDTLAAILSKPAKFIVEKVFGELANAVLLTSTRVVPTRLLQTGYQFRFSDLESALTHTLGKTTIKTIGNKNNV
jgi:NAD dependent epimerase/dehydratase family enzyme